MEQPNLIARENRLSRRALLKAGCSGALLLCGCLRKPEPPLRIGTSLWPGHAPLFLARALGLLKGKPLKLVEYPSTPEIVRGFQNGAVELAVLTADQYLRLTQTTSGLRAVLVTDFSAGADVLLGQSAIGLRDLRGKKAGVEPNSTAAYFLCRALDSASMDRAEIQLIPVRSHLHVEVFKNKSVDALVTSEPHRTRLLREHAEPLFDSSQIKSEMPGLLVVHENVLYERTALLKDLIAAWFSARNHLHQNTTYSSALLASRYDVAPPEFEGFLKVITFPDVRENQELLKEPKLSAQLESIRGHMLRHGLLDGGAPSHSLIEGGLLA